MPALIGAASSLLRIRETEYAVRASIQSLLLLMLLSFLLKLNLSRHALLAGLGLTPILLIVQKQAFASIVRFLHRKGHGIDRVVIYGAREAGRRITSTLLYSPRLGFRPIAMIADHSVPVDDCIFEMGYRRSCSVPIQYGPITPLLLKSLRCNLLIVTMPRLPLAKYADMIQAADLAGASVAVLPRRLAQEGKWTGSIDIDGMMLTSTLESVMPWHYSIAKRVMDVALASLLLVMVSPFLCLIALLIRLDSPGAALFVQKRVGHNGELFDMYKFRSLHTNASRYDLSPSQSSDPRITRVGAVPETNQHG